MAVHEVWITGVGMVSALGAGRQAHLDAIRESRSGLQPRSLFGGNPPDPCICGAIPEGILSPDLDATASSRANQVLELAAHEALRETPSGSLELPATDLVVGTTLGNLHGGTLYYQQLRREQQPPLDLLESFLPCAPAAHLSSQLALRGRHWTISSACGSGTAALGFAFGRIRSGQSSRVVAAGVDVLSPYVVAGFNSLRLVSAQVCKPFDRDRDGLNPGEGAAALVLESAETAGRRRATPLAIVEGFGEALDAYHHTRAHPEGIGLVAAMGRALRTAGTTADTIGHVHLHGTGTQANDIAEYHACRRVFAERLPQIPACSTKSMTGHTFGGAGALSAAFCVLSLNHDIVPPTLFLENRDPAFDGLSVSAEPRTGLSVRRVISLALGFGGEAFALAMRGPGE